MKRIPPLAELTGKAAPRPERQTPEEMEAAGRAWAESFTVH